MIVFRNPGLINLRALKIFGCSAKIHENPHGIFGTGAKHGIAILLRTFHSVTLWRGLDRYTFGTTKADMRGKSFDFVTMTGPTGEVEELPYTLELGKTWQIWQSFRELHSNAIDERGETIRMNPEAFQPQSDQTAITVEGQGIEEAFDQRDTIFLNSTPLFGTDKMQVHAGPSNHAYYRGIRVKDLDKPSHFTYNLLGETQLTEDRTLKSDFDLDYQACQLIGAATDETFLRRVIVPTPANWENDLPCHSVTASEPFLRICGDLRREGHLADLSSFVTNVFTRSQGRLPLPDPVEMNPIQKKQLARAVEFCRSMQWDVDSYPIIVVPHAREGLLAMAEHGKIILTLGLFDQGVKAVCHGLIEEWTHLRFGFRDMTRELQTHLFRQMLGLAEQLKGEAL